MLKYQELQYIIMVQNKCSPELPEQVRMRESLLPQVYIEAFQKQQAYQFFISLIL